MALHGKNILGSQLSAAGTETFQAIDPATSRPLETAFHNATPEELDRAVELADRAFDERGSIEPGKTAALLERIADEIEALGDELIERCGQETALPPGRLKGERARTTGQLRLFAQVVAEGSWVDARIDTPLPDRKPIPKPDLRRMLVPVGTVAVFCASNFPLAFSVAGGDTASALAAGCPVIVKAHSSHPGTAELVATALHRAVVSAGAPAGIFSLVHGPGSRVGIQLVSHPLIRAAGFTGSRRAGRALFDAAETAGAFATWGDMHRLVLGHFFRRLPMIGDRYRFQEHPISGSAETINKTAHPLKAGRSETFYGACARHISDFSDSDENYFVLLGGQDGRLNSDAALDQVPLWLEGKSIRVPLRLESVRTAFRHHQDLQPSSARPNQR